MVFNLLVLSFGLIDAYWELDLGLRPRATAKAWLTCMTKPMPNTQPAVICIHKATCACDMGRLDHLICDPERDV
jgi:hypothetical protein